MVHLSLLTDINAAAERSSTASQLGGGLDRSLRVRGEYQRAHQRKLHCTLFCVATADDTTTTVSEPAQLTREASLLAPLTTLTATHGGAGTEDGSPTRYMWMQATLMQRLL